MFGRSSRLVLSLLALASAGVCAPASADLVTGPYLQAPEPEAMTVVWFSRTKLPGRLTVDGPGMSRSLDSLPQPAGALGYQPQELRKLKEPSADSMLYVHRVRLTGLRPGGRYDYTVVQGTDTRESSFRASPKGDAAIRFIVYADSETEPESFGKRVPWPQPFGDPNRTYPADANTGYAENLRVIQSRQPDFVAIAGDLVACGGEQRDWDDFWRHNAGALGDLASRTLLLPALGNHDLYGGAGELGGWHADAVRRALDKYRTYFSLPDNGSPDPNDRGRYYRVDYGPVTLITLDSTDGLPPNGPGDTNFHLPDPNGGPGGPDFHPGSRQYQWLEARLAEAQARSRFTFVQFHHAPYSVGPHGFEPGNGGYARRQNEQSGVAMRVLTPLLIRYGVDAVFCGHDEMYERSVVRGEEVRPDGTKRPHEVHFYDIGIGGDDLRGPLRGKDGTYGGPGNEQQAFLAHLDAPEAREGQRLVSGGKHYGHLEVNVYLNSGNTWVAQILPAYVFPVLDANGAVLHWERRVYNDIVMLHAPNGKNGAMLPYLLVGLGVLLVLGLRQRRRRRREEKRVGALT